MLDREEDAALAEIEAALRREDPQFVSMLEQLEQLDWQPVAGEPGGAPFEREPFLTDEDSLPLVLVDTPVRRWPRVLGTVVIFALAIAATLAVTAFWGPDAGGLAGVITTMAATMYGYQALWGCPGRR